MGRELLTFNQVSEYGIYHDKKMPNVMEIQFYFNGKFQKLGTVKRVEFQPVNYSLKITYVRNNRVEDTIVNSMRYKTGAVRVYEDGLKKQRRGRGEE